VPGRTRTAQDLPEAQALAMLETAAAVVRETAAGRRHWWGEPGCRGSVKGVDFPVADAQTTINEQRPGSASSRD